MKLKECMEMEIEDFRKLLNPPAGSAMGIPLVTAVPLVGDVKPPPPPGPRQGIDFRTALDLIQFESGSPERLACTDLPDADLLGIARAERETPDAEKQRFVIKR